MKVERVGVTLSYSEDAGAGRRTVELRAEGVPDTRETWQQAMAQLNQELRATMRQLWPARERAGPDPPPPLTSPPASIRPPEMDRPNQVRPHWCAEHEKEWKPRVNKDNGRTFFSHYQRDLNPPWCNEPPG